LKLSLNKFLLLLFVSFSLNLSIASPSNAEDSKILTLKAFTLLNFVNYISVVKDSSEICVIDDEDVFQILNKINESRKGKSKVNTIKEIEQSQAASCALVFTSKDNSQDLARLVNIVGNKKIVTVSDKSGFIVLGGIIELFEDEGRIKFAINLKKANLNKISMDSRLIEAADRVE
jgi:hypothetical protein